MDLNRAAVFARVAEAGGVSAAADALRLPKSSVSRSVRALEDELGVRLLQKEGRRVGLTEAGRLFYGGVAQGLAAMEEARAAAGGLQGGMRGVVRIAAPAELAAWMLTPVLAAFLERYPEVETEVRSSSRPVDLLRDGGIDLALHVGAVRSDALASRDLGGGYAGLFAAPAYLARRGTPAEPADLAAHDFVLGGLAGGGDEATLLREDGALATVALRGRHRTDTLSGVQVAVRAGMGIGTLPRHVAREPGGVELVHVLPAWAVRVEPLHLVWPRTRHVPRRVALLRDAIADTVAPACRALDLPPA